VLGKRWFGLRGSLVAFLGLFALPFIWVLALAALYTDYASDRNGDYTFFIGAKVSDTSAIPAAMVAKRVPAGKFAVVTSAQGAVQNVVPKAWQQIWSLEDKSELGGARSYNADFEVYDQRSRDPQDSQVDVYVGIQ